MLGIILKSAPKIKDIPKKSPLHSDLYSATESTEATEKESIVNSK